MKNRIILFDLRIKIKKSKIRSMMVMFQNGKQQKIMSRSSFVPIHINHKGQRYILFFITNTYSKKILWIFQINKELYSR
jgi:hypothetical protein